MRLEGAARRRGRRPCALSRRSRRPVSSPCARCLAALPASAGPRFSRARPRREANALKAPPSRRAGGPARPD
eukprot:7243270-Pyramimonas_sp.AAC.1